MDNGMREATGLCLLSFVLCPKKRKDKGQKTEDKGWNHNPLSFVFRPLSSKIIHTNGGEYGKICTAGEYVPFRRMKAARRCA